MAESKQERAKRNYEMLFDFYMDRVDFISRYKECRDFRIHKQWTEAESAKLYKAGMIDYPMNRIRPNYRNKKAVVMSKRPTIKLTSTRGKHSPAVTEFQRLIYYIWNISDGLPQSQRMLDAYFDAGMGVLQVYEDPEADYGRGELKIRECDPEYLYFPRSTTGINFDDARNMFYAKYVPIDEILNEYGHKRGVTRESLQAQTDHTRTFLSESVHRTQERQTINQGLEGDFFTSREDLCLLCEHYMKVKEDREIVKVINTQNGNIDMFITPPEVDITEFLEERGVVAFEIEDRTETKVTRVQRETTAGYNLFLDDTTLPISHFPFGYCIGEDTRNAYPVGDVFFNIGSQKMVNHLASLITYIGQTVAMPKMITKKGAFKDTKHKNEVQQNMSVPNYIVELDIDENQPLGNWLELFQGGQVPPILGQLLQMNIGAIDYDTATFPMQMGDPTGAPNTAFGSGLLSENNDRMTQIPLLAMQTCFTRVFNVLAEWIPNYYDIEKYFELVEGRRIEEGSINVSDLDSEEIYADIRNLDVKVYVEVGSHMSVSKIVSQLLYKDLANVNPIFIKLLLQNEDSIDEEDKKALLEELDALPKMQQAIAQQEDQINILSQALQELDAERLKQIERRSIEKTQGNLKAIQAAEKARSEERLKKQDNGEE